MCILISTNVTKIKLARILVFLYLVANRETQSLHYTSKSHAPAVPDRG